MPDFSAGPLENTCVPNRSATAHELARGRHGVPFAMTGVQDKLPHHSVRHHHDGIDHARKNQCIEEASAAGVRGAALGVALSAPAVAAAHHLSRRFRRHGVLKNARCLLCIHNLFHQGKSPLPRCRSHF